MFSAIGNYRKINNSNIIRKLDVNPNKNYNSNVFMKPALAQDKFQRRKISFGVKMDKKEDKATFQEIQNKIVKIIFGEDGISEYPNKNEKYAAIDNQDSTVVEYYDKNGIKRQEISYNYGQLTDVLFYDANGNETRYVEVTYPQYGKYNVKIDDNKYSAESSKITLLNAQDLSVSENI